MAHDASYPLHTDLAELERLRFQHEVWGDQTRAFLTRLGVREGMRVLDLGCGPGFVSLELARLVGPTGRVTALDESSGWHAWLSTEARRLGIANLVQVETRLQHADFPEDSFDLVFGRWFWSFVPDPCTQARRVARWLSPGGVFALQDYHHEGIALHPPARGFDAVVRGLRAMYANHGGDAFVAARAPEMFAAAGLATLELRPTIRCGAPGSPLHAWADGFFPRYARKLLAGGWIAAAECEQFEREWRAHSTNPHALFWSPVVLDAAGVK
jgi:SAM-dependent methyltransferase